MSECVVDINMVAIYVMIKGCPGIKRARLYKNKHGAEIFERMERAGLIACDDKGCCSLTEDGDRFGLFVKDIVKIMGDESVVQEYIDGLIEWYQEKIEKNRLRNRGECTEAKVDEHI